MLFASQAALAIANARRHREERRARADLETLIDTSPVGVVVFDGRTGLPVSINREMLRIVDGLRDPGQPPEHLLEVLTVTRADGSEISLEELPLSQALSASETVRAEEIVLRVPDGRSVRALLNATPIRSEEGEVESFVAVLQDMTPLEEQERLRAEFLAMVSHELRTPLAAVKGSVSTLREPPGPLNPADVRQFHTVIEAQTDRMNLLISDLLDVARIETGALSVSPGATDVAALLADARSAFRSGGGRHQVGRRAGGGPALGDGGPGAHGAGAGQPALQCGPELAGALPHPGERRRGGGPGGGVCLRPGPGHPGGETAPPVPEVLPDRLGGAGGRHRPGSGRLQGDSGSPRGPHLGRERRSRPGGAVHLHYAHGGTGRVRDSGSVNSAPSPFFESGRNRCGCWRWTTTPRPSGSSGTPW